MELFIIPSDLLSAIVRLVGSAQVFGLQYNIEKKYNYGKLL